MRIIVWYLLNKEVMYNEPLILTWKTKIKLDKLMNSQKDRKIE